jgi:hypothetical protein
VSHIPQRKEKDCLNCGTVVQGRYCQNCGQENVIPKETFWHMVTHFFYDITHFDSNFFHTIHHLVLKPGFLSKEYMNGRRASYLHPIKMYVFTSAIFFLLFFSLFKTKDTTIIDVEKPLAIKERNDYIISLQNKLKKDANNKKLIDKIILFQDTSRQFTAKDTVDIDLNVLDYKNIAEYDSFQNRLPSSQRDGWLKKRLIKQRINLVNKFKENPNEALTKLLEGLFHRLPYLLFVSLPLFAFILKLVYLRRKQFYFADHGVFTIHLYVFSFILLLFIFGFDKLQKFSGWGFLNTFEVILFLWMIFHLYFAMHYFYKQGWGKTFLKFLIVSFISLIMMVVLFAFFLLFSAFII